MEKVLFYHYDDNFEYCSTTEAEYEPIEHKLLIPAKCTIKPLPKKRKKYSSFVFDELTEKWVELSDFRNVEVFHKETLELVRYTKLGDLPKELTHLKPNIDSKWSFELNRWVVDIDKRTMLRKKLRDMYLAETDWYAIRFIETGVKIPKNITKYREHLRTITDRKNWPNIVVPKPPNC